MRYRDYFFTRHVNRVKIRFSRLGSGGEKDDITIVCGVRNRCDYRLVNAFKSLRTQDYDEQLVHIVLVDYDSDGGLVQQYKEICERFNAKYIRVEGKPLWNKSHCLNIAIKRAATKYICSTDVDVFFESNFISECIKELRARPYQVLLSDFYNSPRGTVDAEVDVVNSYRCIKEVSSFQVTGMGKSGALNPGINVALTRSYKAINGYDEQYVRWGSEDFDLIKRLVLLGLKVKDMSASTSWIHQYHEKHEGHGSQDEVREQIRKNKLYLDSTHTVVRNPDGWGHT